MSRFENDEQFRGAVSQVLRSLLDQVDDIDADDFDAQLTEGSLMVQFDAGDTFMLSQQTPTHELWLSANLRAWHFQVRDGQWVERDSLEPMIVVLGQLFSERLGPVQFRL